MTSVWRRGRACLVVGSIAFLVGVPAVGHGEMFPDAAGTSASGPAAASARSAGQQKKVGPPQVIEILVPAAPRALPSLPWQADFEAQPVFDEPPVAPAAPPRPSRPGYLGVLYATVEDGSGGVRVLGVVPGSPAERAGFSATSPPPTEPGRVSKIG